MTKFIVLSLLLASQIAFAEKVHKFSVMTYNLENLFDKKHDQGKSDWTYLPLAVKLKSIDAMNYCNSLVNPRYKKSCLELDWSEKVLKHKLYNLGKVIKEFNSGHGADVVVFQEVENKRILKRLIDEELSGLGYKEVILIEGPDTRGIDVAMISKLSLKSQKLHQVSMRPHSNRTTRGVLEARFRLGKKSVSIFANHWPSQGNPDGTRVNAANVLLKAALKSRSDLVVAAGDFNTVADDEINALKSLILPHFLDVEVQGRRQTRQHAPGTHWYKGHWESLDKIFVLKKKTSNIDYKSFHIIYEPYMLTDTTWSDEEGERHDSNVPMRFDPLSGAGYSDHLPVGVSLSL